MKKPILIIWFYFFCTVLWCQSTQIDKLEEVWKNENIQDSLRLVALHKIFKIKLKKEPAAALRIAKEQLVFAQTHQSIYWEGKALNNLGFAYKKNGDIERGLEHFFLSLAHNTKEAHLLGMSVNCNNIARMYRENFNNYQKSITYLQKSIEYSGAAQEHGYQAGRYYRLAKVFREIGAFPQALDALFQGLDIYQTEKDTSKMIEGNLLIANLHQQTKDYHKALKYNQITLSLSQDIGAKKTIAMAYHNIGNAYFLLEQNNIAMSYYLKSLDIKQALKDEKGMANNYHNLGNIYLRQNNIQKAAEYYQLSAKIYKKYNNNRDLSNSYCALGEVEISLGHFLEAIKWCQQGLEIAQNDQQLNLDRQMINSECLAIAYEKLGEYQQAITYKNIAYTLKDSLYDAEENRKLSQLEAKYKYENEKEKLLLEQQKNETAYEAQLQQQSYLLFILAIIVLFLAGLAYLGYKNYLTKKESHQQLEQKNKKIVADKKLIEQQAKDIQQLDKLKTKFFTQVSHELRTPLTLMNTPIEIIRHQYQESLRPEVKEQLDLAAKNGKKLSQLIEELLDLQKLGLGKVSLQESPTLLLSFIHQIYQNFVPLAQAKYIDYQFNTNIDSQQQYTIDQKRVEKIINNLLSNALKFTPKHGSVQLHLNTTTDTIIIQVVDNGLGISAEALPYIFDPYYQATSPNKNWSEGFGIGLAYAKELSMLMGGRLTVISKIGEGSTFEWRIHRSVLNIKEITQTEKEVATIPLHPVAQDKKIKFPPRPYTLLIVEDNPDMQVLLHRLLSPFYQVVLCAHGQEAINELQKKPPHSSIDFILSDIMMPIMDGYTLLKVVKNHHEWKQLPFLLLTAKTQEQDKLKGLRMGVDDYLIKPFSSEELLVRIQNLLQNYEERKLHQGENILSNTVKSTEKSVQNQSNDDWLETVNQTIQQAIEKQQNLKVVDLAAQLFMSDRQLRRRLQKLTGLNPNKYILEVKLTRARHLLENKKMLRVKEVMHQSGFNNKSYFSKVYLERFGVLPSSYF